MADKADAPAMTRHLPRGTRASETRDGMDNMVPCGLRDLGLREVIMQRSNNEAMEMREDEIWSARRDSWKKLIL